MNGITELPSAQADPVEHADWVEVDAIRSRDGSSSYETFASQIHISGTTETMVVDNEDVDDDGGGELSQLVADSAWAEIGRRFRACGGDGGSYPFDVTSGGITLKDEWQSSAYIFQLLLTKLGKDAGPPETYGERIFEHLSSHAGRLYFGGPTNSASCFRFGFPRPDRTGFLTALTALCKELRAGSVNREAALINQQQDSHLDVVVWRSFADRRESQLIGFGQCATGMYWQDKLTELQPDNFANEWLSKRFYPEPVRMFFLPQCIESKRWNHVTLQAGLLFDRCRISNLTGQLVGELSQECEGWSAAAVARLQDELT